MQPCTLLLNAKAEKKKERKILHLAAFTRCKSRATLAKKKLPCMSCDEMQSSALFLQQQSTQQQQHHKPLLLHSHTPTCLRRDKEAKKKLPRMWMNVDLHSHTPTCLHRGEEAKKKPPCMWMNVDLHSLTLTCLRRDEEAKKKLPRMSWMNVDLHQLAQQKASNAVALPGQPGQRALRRADSSAPSKKSNRCARQHPPQLCVHAMRARTVLLVIRNQQTGAPGSTVHSCGYACYEWTLLLLLAFREQQTGAPDSSVPSCTCA